MFFNEKAENMLKTLSEATSAALDGLFAHISENPSVPALAVLCALLSYIVIYIYKLKLYRNMQSRMAQIFIHVLFPFVFALFTYYYARTKTGEPLFIMLNYIGFFWLTGSILKVPSRFLNITVRGSFALTMWLIFAALLTEIYSDLLRLYASGLLSKIRNFNPFLDALSRLFLAAGFYLYLRSMGMPLLDALKKKAPLFSFIRIPASVLRGVFVLAAVLWIAGIIRLDFRFVMTAGLIVLVSALITQVTSASESIAVRFYKQENYTQLEWTLIQKNISRFAVALMLYVFYNLGHSLLDIADIMEKIKSAYLINTALFKLSAASIFSAFMLFILLKSLLFLLGKYMRVALNNGVQNTESGSLEVLISNIGMLFIVMAVLLELGLTWQVIVPVAGALGIGIGFGIQTIVNNYISGFILLFSKKVKIGDHVELNGSAGRAVGVTSETIFGVVSSIDMFATTVKTFDNFEIMVPNSVFISDTIINYTKSDNLIRVRIPVGIAYSSDIELAQRLMLECIGECPSVVKSYSPEVWFMEYGDSSVNFNVIFWLDISEGMQLVAVRNIFLQSLWHKFKEHGIEIPFPQQDVWFRNTLVHIDAKEQKQ